MTTVVDEYQEQTEALAATTATAVLALYATLQTGGLAPAVVVPAMAAVIAVANATATTLADLAVSAQIESATAQPQPPIGIAPRDDTERLTKAVRTILDDLPEPNEPAEQDEDDAAENEEPADEEPVDEDGDGDEDAEEPDDVAEPDEDEPDQQAEQPAEEDSHKETDEDEIARMRLERLARSEPLGTGQAVTVEIINRLPVVTGWTRKLDDDPCERCQRWAEQGRVFPKGHHFKTHFGCNCAAEIVTIERNAAS
ncbi:MAG: hypothetical protein K0U84_07640 [Actinomycetia bacterium]|nr:hypothetical protein [Actinomycetes bacterium]